MNKKINRGYTLIELLIAFTIIAILSSIGIFSYQDFNQRQILKGAVLNFKNNLRATQSKAFNSEKPSRCSGSLLGHKIKFIDNQNYQILAVCPEETLISNFFLGENINKTAGPNWVFFKILAQGIITENNEHDFCFSAFNRNYRISISTSGEIKDYGFVSSCP